MYIGGRFGFGFGGTDTQVNPLPDPVSFGALMPTTLESSFGGPFGGVYAGYDQQYGQLIAGIVADFNWGNVTSSERSSPIIQNNGTPFSVSSFIDSNQEIEWFGSLRGRAGVQLNRIVLYATGGLAYGNVTYSALTRFPPVGDFEYPAYLSDTKWGWTLGGGLEVAITDCLTWKIEYLYYDLGSESFVANPVPANPPFQVSYDWETTFHTINTGLAFHF